MTRQPSSVTRCRICENAQLETVLQLGDQKLTGIFPASTNEAVLGGPLDLVRCAPDHGCGLLQLRHSYPLEAMYGDHYGYRSGLNQWMVRHLTSKNAWLSELSGVADGDLVLDIGSNDGTLLNAYSNKLRRVGIDPVAKKFLDRYAVGIEVIAEFFSRDLWLARFGAERAKIVTSIAMFYDIERPLEFVRGVRECLADDGVWHFEQSYMPLMVERCAYDTICHEHLEYYALRQLKWLVRESGLKIIHLSTNDANGGSLAVTVARAESKYPEATREIAHFVAAEQAAGFEGMEPLYAFHERVFEHRSRLRELIQGARASGMNLLGYGASTKGNVLLQFCGLTSTELPCIGEVNPEKYGHFTPGTSIPIVSESEMHRMRPDALVVLPWHLRENLVQREQAFLQRGGRLLFPLPMLEYVSA